MNKSGIILLSAVMVALPAHAMGWFEQNTALTQAHEHLLKNDLNGMFSSLVEVWQSDDAQNLSQHLNSLLMQSLTKDCGKSLTTNSFPDWLVGVSIRRQTVQSPGRDTHRLMLDALAKTQLNNISLHRWVDTIVSADSEFQQGSKSSDGKLRFEKLYNLPGELQDGLYRLNVVNAAGEDWSSWIILGDLTTARYVRWASKEKWKVEKKSLLNPYCPLPEMNVTLSDYRDGKYENVWSKSYEANYPDSVELKGIPNDRYVLSVSMNNRRWQGNIIIEDLQTISKTYDISDGE